MSRKARKTKDRFSFRVNPETLKILELKARSEDRTLSWLVNHVLEQWVAAMIPPGKAEKMRRDLEAAEGPPPTSTTSRPASDQ
jgi:hypothetical protein